MSISWMDNKSYGFQPHLIRNCCPNVSARFETFKVTCRSSLAMETFLSYNFMHILLHANRSANRTHGHIQNKTTEFRILLQLCSWNFTIIKMKRNSGCWINLRNALRHRHDPHEGFVIIVTRDTWQAWRVSVTWSWRDKLIWWWKLLQSFNTIREPVKKSGKFHT